MNLPRLLVLAAFALCAGCNSLENPFAGVRLLKTGQDARAFNPQTGEYEWPKDAAPRPKTKREPGAVTPATTPAPKPDGRPYDPQKGEFADPDPTR